MQGVGAVAVLIPQLEFERDPGVPIVAVLQRVYRDLPPVALVLPVRPVGRIELPADRRRPAQVSLTVAVGVPVVAVPGPRPAAADGHHDPPPAHLVPLAVVRQRPGQPQAETAGLSFRDGQRERLELDRAPVGDPLVGPLLVRVGLVLGVNARRRQHQQQRQPRDERTGAARTASSLRRGVGSPREGRAPETGGWSGAQCTAPADPQTDTVRRPASGLAPSSGYPANMPLDDSRPGVADQQRRSSRHHT